MAGKSIQSNGSSLGKRKPCESRMEEDGREHSSSLSIRTVRPDEQQEDLPELLHMASYPPGTKYTFTDFTPDSPSRSIPEENIGFDKYETRCTKRQMFFTTPTSSEKKYQDYRPTLPGTHCQFGLPTQRTLLQDSTRTELISNSSSSNPNQTLMSPESGIECTTSPNAQSSPSASYLQGLASSSGIGSAQEIMEYEVTPFATSQTIEEESQSLDNIEMEKTKKDMIQQMKKFLQRRFVYLKDEIMPREVASRLYNDQVIPRKDLEAITDAKGRRHKCDVLIKAISHSLEAGNGNIVQRIKDAFKKENYEYIFNDFEAYSCPAESTDKGNSNSMQWKDKLELFAAKMEDELDPHYFIDELVSEEVLELDEHQNILTVSFKPEKVTCLVKYLRKKTQQIYEKFCKVIKKSYSNNTFVYEFCNTQSFGRLEMEELKEPNIPPPVYIVRQEEHTCKTTPTATAHIKFEFDGNAKDIERMIVEENAPYPNNSLQEEAMDIGAYEIVDTTFSSIRIVLSALSQRSEMQILKKCKQSPVFLMKLLQSLIKTEHLQKLKDRKIRRIFFEIKVQWPDSKTISKEDVTRCLGYLESRITKEEILRVLGNIKGSEELFDEIKMTESSKACFKKFAEFLVNGESETVVDLFVEDLKKHKRAEIIAKLEAARQQRDKHACSCHIVKENIVEHYTLIEKEMTHVEDIIKAFSEFPGFSSDVQDEFKELLGSPKETRLDFFLRKLLTLPDDGLQLCLLEERLHATRQVQLMEKVTKSSSTKDDITVTEDDIRRNRLFLCDELEPKQYFDMFDDKDGVCDQILSAVSRKVRCEILLDVVLKKSFPGDKNHMLSKFSQKLLKRNPEVLQYITDSRRSKQEGERQPMKENIIVFYKHIVEEIEPRSFLKFFEERQELSNEEIKCILDSSSRRARAIALMNCVLKGSETRAICLIDALLFAGYVSLSKKLQESTRDYKECPRIYHAFQGNEECFVFKGELEIDFSAENPAEFKPSSSMPVFKKWSLVTNWVLENFFAKREENKTYDQEENTENNTDGWKQVKATDMVANENNRSTPASVHVNTDKVDEGNIACKAKIPKEQSSTPEASSSVLPYCGLHGLCSVCQCSSDSRYLLDPNCGERGTMESPSSNYSGFNPIRNDEIFDNNSASCSPSSTIPSRVSRNGSSENENNELLLEVPQVEEALKMFDEGYIY